MCTVFINCHSIADLKHIWIIPMSFPCILTKRIIIVYTLHDSKLLITRELMNGIECTPYIWGRSPAITYITGPFPRLIIAPLTHTEEDWPSRSTQCIAHELISTFCIRSEERRVGKE